MGSGDKNEMDLALAAKVGSERGNGGNGKEEMGVGKGGQAIKKK